MSAPDLGLMAPAIARGSIALGGGLAGIVAAIRRIGGIARQAVSETRRSGPLARPAEYKATRYGFGR